MKNAAKTALAAALLGAVAFVLWTNRARERREHDAQAPSRRSAGAAALDDPEDRGSSSIGIERDRSAAPARSPATASSMWVRLVTLAGATVPTGTIVLREDHRDVAVADVGENGVAKFRGLRAGTFVPWIVRESLPAGVLPPRWQREHFDDAADESEPPYAIHHPGTCEAGFTVTLGSQATITGVVYGPDSQPTRAAFVRVSAWRPARNSRVIDADIGDDDRYVACVDPGTWLVQVQPGPSRAAAVKFAARGQPLPTALSALLQLPVPPPVLVDLVDGQHRDVEFHFGAGDSRLFGSVLDQRGEPFGGLDLYLRHAEILDASGKRSDPGFAGLAAHVVTALDGTFSFDRLSQGLYFVVPNPEGYRVCARTGEGVLGVPPANIPCSIGPGGTSLGTITIPRSDPVRLTGRIELQPSWSRAHAAVVSQIAASLVVAKGATHTVDVRCAVEIEANGTISGFVQRLEQDVTLELAFGDTRMRIPLDTRNAGGVLAIGTVSFPGL